MKEIRGTIVEKLVVGEFAFIQLEDGRMMRTSPVRHYVEYPNGNVDIITKNSEYRVIKP